jgi:hypothetical protein
MHTRLQELLETQKARVRGSGDTYLRAYFHHGCETFGTIDDLGLIDCDDRILVHIASKLIAKKITSLFILGAVIISVKPLR